MTHTSDSNTEQTRTATPTHRHQLREPFSNACHHVKSIAVGFLYGHRVMTHQSHDALLLLLRIFSFWPFWPTVGCVGGEVSVVVGGGIADGTGGQGNTTTGFAASTQVLRCNRAPTTPSSIIPACLRKQIGRMMKWCEEGGAVGVGVVAGGVVGMAQRERENWIAHNNATAEEGGE